MMMKQNIVIYIILSAILLYLYYKKHDKMILVVVAVLVGSLLFSKDILEGAKGGRDSGLDKECAKLGFKEPKIDKNDIKGSLDKILKNLKKVVEKYADVGEGGFIIKKSEESLKVIFKNDTAKDILTKWREDTNNNLSELFNYSFMLFDPYIYTPSEEKQQKFIDDKLSEIVKNKQEFKKIINGGNRIVKMFEDTKKLDETKQLDKKDKTVLDVAICAFKHTVMIWKSLDKAISGGKDDDSKDEDEEEKSKKKKKKETKKKSDDNEGDDE